MFPMFLLTIENEDDRIFFAQLYSDHGTLMMACAFRILGNEHDAADAVNTAFVRLIQKSHVLKEVEASKVRQYLVRTAKNVAINILNKRQREQGVTFSIDAEDVHEFITDGNSIENEVITKVATEDVIRALKCLPMQEQAAMSMCYLEGASDKEIALHLSIQPSTVRKYLTSGRRHLYEKLGGDNYDAPQ